MRIALRNPLEWRRKFALRPRIVGNNFIWLEYYEYRERPDIPSYQALWVERRLPGNAASETHLRLLGWT